MQDRQLEEIMAKYYSMSDIHGHYDEFIESLSKVDFSDKNSLLILLGDYIDNGSQSLQVISKIIELEKYYPDQVITLLGNHEEYFVEWLLEEETAKYSSSATINSFISQNNRETIVNSVISDLSFSDEECLNQIDKKMKDYIIAEYPEIVDWLKDKFFNTERFFETDHQIFVHAGIDEELGQNWKLFSNPDIFTKKFPASIGKFYKDIIAGHIYSEEIAKDSDVLGKIYFDNYNHYYIDGHVSLSKTIPILAFDTTTKKYHYL